LQLQSKVL